jgi:adenylate cyclase
MGRTIRPKTFYSDRMRVPRTFLFVDLTGFTNFTEQNGDDAAGRLLSNFRALTRQVASERGIRIAKWLGDGAMIVALNQRDAISFALDLEALATLECSPLAIRSGIATGKALLFEGDDYIGSAVNLASRLCDAAKAHEVLVLSDQVEELPDGVISADVGEYRLPGFPDPLTVTELSGLPMSSLDDSGEIWARSPFVG